MSSDRKVTYQNRGNMNAKVSPEEAHRKRRVEATIRKVSQALRDVRGRPDELRDVANEINRQIREEK